MCTQQLWGVSWEQWDTGTRVEWAETRKNAPQPHPSRRVSVSNVPNCCTRPRSTYSCSSRSLQYVLQYEPDGGVRVRNVVFLQYFHPLARKHPEIGRGGVIDLREVSRCVRFVMSQ